jgi:hypothetical protein
MTDTIDLLGKLLTGDIGRDAVHIAVAPVIAGCDLNPNDRIGLIKESTEIVVWYNVTHIGIVDPFLEEPVKKGQRFFMFLFPATITSLRHEWTHPAFNEVQLPSHNKEVSEQWLRDFIDGADCPAYESLMDDIQTILEGGVVTSVNPKYYGAHLEWTEDWLHFNGSDAHGEIPPEFWTHVEIVLGMKIPKDKKATRFSCSC